MAPREEQSCRYAFLVFEIRVSQRSMSHGAGGGGDTGLDDHAVALGGGGHGRRCAGRARRPVAAGRRSRSRCPSGSPTASAPRRPRRCRAGSGCRRLSTMMPVLEKLTAPPSPVAMTVGRNRSVCRRSARPAVGPAGFESIEQPGGSAGQRVTLGEVVDQIAEGGDVEHAVGVGVDLHERDQPCGPRASAVPRRR